MAPIHDAARDADVETLRRLLAEGVSPDATDNEERTPLHLLCEYNNVGYNASSPLALRTQQRYAYDRLDCFKLLRDAGANLEATTKWDSKPIHCTACSGSVELLSLLVQSGVNVDAATTGGTTALHFAVRMGPNNCIEVLLAAGASLNLREVHNNNTPFDVALHYGTGGGHAPPEQRARSRRTWPLFLRAGAEVPAIYTDSDDQYLFLVVAAGGFQRYAQAHVARIASILETPLLPPELVRKVLEFWLHAGYY